MDKNIRTLHGDCLELMKAIESETIDLIVTDPPYNLCKDYGNDSDRRSREEYLDFTRKWLFEEQYRLW